MRPHQFTRSLVAAAAALTLIAGCGGDDEPSAAGSSTTPTASLTGPGTDISENFVTGNDFIDALAANTPESLAGAKSLVAPKSGAARYLTRTAKALAKDAAPLDVTEPNEGRFRLCAGPQCSVLSDLVLSDGKVSSFKVDGKQVR